MGFATKWKTKKLCAKEWSKRHIFLSHFFIFHHKSKRMLNFLRNGFWIVIVQKVRKKCLSHSGKMHFSVSGHVTLGVVWWRHELDYICPLWVLSKFGAIEAYMCRVIADWFFPSNGIKRYFNGPLKWYYDQIIISFFSFYFESVFAKHPTGKILSFLFYLKAVYLSVSFGFHGPPLLTLKTDR